MSKTMWVVVLVESGVAPATDIYSTEKDAVSQVEKYEKPCTPIMMMFPYFKQLKTLLLQTVEFFDCDHLISATS